MPRWWIGRATRLESRTGLDGAVQALAGIAPRLLPSQRLRDALNGTWLGHPVHPLLVSLPIGLWTGAALLDALPRSGPAGTSPAARTLVGAGVLGAVPTAAAGLADWNGLGKDLARKRVGVVHAAANATALAAFTASWAARRGERPRVGVATSLLGLGALTVGGYLGAHLSYTQGVGVDRNDTLPDGPQDWTASDLADLPAGGHVAGAALQEPDGVRVAVTTSEDGAPAGLGAVCSHLGGPVDEGTVVRVRGRACIRCPWHGSTFAVDDGSVLVGPASAPQPAYEVRAGDGAVQARRRGA